MKTRNQDFIRAAGFEPVPCFSGTYNVEAAVQNYMSGKTHFYDAGSMAFFSCKVRKARCIDDGVILGTICTQAEGFHGGRVYVVNFHDFMGHSLCSSLGEREFKTMKQADAYFWERANAMDGRAIMLDAIRRERDDARRKAKHLTDFMRSKKRAFSKGVTE